MLFCLEKTNKYQILIENLSFLSFLSLFLCFILLYFYLKINNLMLGLINAYLSCINFFIAICVFIVVLLEKLMPEIFCKTFITEHVETNYKFFFFIVFFLIGMFFIYNKKLFLNNKKEKTSIKMRIYNFVDFFIKNLGYFFFNGFAIGRCMVGGIVKNTTEGIIDTNIVEAVENAKFEPPKSKLLKIPKTQEEFVVFVADNATEIRKDPLIRDACIRHFNPYRLNDKGFRLVTQETYDEFESAAKFLMLNGERSILIGNFLPLWYPNVPHGPDVFLPSQNTLHQIKTCEKMRVRNIVVFQKEYGQGMLKGSLLLNSFFVYIPEEERNRMLKRYDKNPQIYKSMFFTDSTTLLPSKPKDFVLMKTIAFENEARMQQIRNEMLKESIINPNRIRKVVSLIKI